MHKNVVVSIRSPQKRYTIIPVFILIGIVFTLVFLIHPVSAQDDFCPAGVAQSITGYYYSCKNTQDPQACRQYNQASYCAAKCYPACYIKAPSGYDISGVSCSCDSGGSTSSNPPKEPEFPWVVVIGAIGALGVAAVAGAKLLGGKKSTPSEKTGEKEKKEKKKGESVTYILQLSADHLSVSAEQSASLTITVWKKEGDSPPTPEPGAVVTVMNPAGSGLSVTPSAGNSPLQAEVALAGEPKEPTAILGITATAGGTTKKAEVTVDVSSKTRIEFT